MRSVRYALFEPQRDAVILVARVLLMVLFVWGGWGKLTSFSGTVGEMIQTGLPLPHVAAVVAIIAEFLFGILIVVGFYARPLALLVAIYTLATAFIGHHYWTMTGPAQAANMINFYKNVSIVGGLLLLAATGAGRYSVDGYQARRARTAGTVSMDGPARQ